MEAQVLFRCITVAAVSAVLVMNVSCRRIAPIVTTDLGGAKAVQVFVGTMQEVRVGVGGRVVPADQVGAELQRARMPRNVVVLLVHMLETDTRAVKATLKGLTEAGYHDVLTVPK